MISSANSFILLALACTAFVAVEAGTGQMHDRCVTGNDCEGQCGRTKYDLHIGRICCTSEIPCEIEGTPTGWCGPVVAERDKDMTGYFLFPVCNEPEGGSTVRYKLGHLYALPSPPTHPNTAVILIPRLRFILQCFHADSIVHKLVSGDAEHAVFAPVSLRSVRYGDVLASAAWNAASARYDVTPSPVVAVVHRLLPMRAAVLHIALGACVACDETSAAAAAATTTTTTLRVTGQHLVFAGAAASPASMALRQAATVQVGDYMLATSSADALGALSVRRVVAVRADAAVVDVANVATESGVLLVDGVMASQYLYGWPEVQQLFFTAVRGVFGANSLQQISDVLDRSTALVTGAALSKTLPADDAAASERSLSHTFIQMNAPLIAFFDSNYHVLSQ